MRVAEIGCFRRMADGTLENTVVLENGETAEARRYDKVFPGGFRNMIKKEESHPNPEACRTLTGILNAGYARMPESCRKHTAEVKLFGGFLRNPGTAGDIDIHIRLIPEDGLSVSDYNEIADMTETFLFSPDYVRIFGIYPDFVIETGETAMGAEQGKGLLLPVRIR